MRGAASDEELDERRRLQRDQAKRDRMLKDALRRQLSRSGGLGQNGNLRAAARPQDGTITNSQAVRNMYHDQMERALNMSDGGGGLLSDDNDGRATLDDEDIGEDGRRMIMKMSRRLTRTTEKIRKWHEKLGLRQARKLALRTPEQEWLASFYRCDPRYQSE